MTLLRKKRAGTEDQPTRSRASRERVGVRGIVGHLAVCDTGTWAWYVLDGAPWNMRPQGERDAVLANQTLRWADLVGHRVHLRVTRHPVAHAALAEKLDKTSPNRLPDVDGAQSWGAHLEATQRRIVQQQLSESAVYLGVRLTTKQIHPNKLHILLDRKHAANEQMQRLRSDLDRITAVIGGDGFRGSRCTGMGLAWLFHGSVGLHLPVSILAMAGSDGTWERAHIAQFTEPVQVTAAPYARYLDVTALRDGYEHRKLVRVLSVGQMRARNTDDPSRAPWMGFTASLPFPVEWSGQFDVMAPETQIDHATRMKTRAHDMQQAYAEARELPPPRLGRALEDAIRVEDELSDAPTEVATRLVGHWRLALAADTASDLDRLTELTTQAFARDQKITVGESYGQYDLYREFTPGEQVRIHGFEHTLPTRFMAAAVPNLSTAVGTPTGPYLGFTIGAGSRPVLFDTTHGPRRNKSGLGLFVSDPGGGKSTLAGAIADDSARRGYATVVFDPSGPMANLCRVPHLAPYARHIDLLSAQPGTLNPYRLIPDPDRNDPEAKALMRDAEAERRELMTDVLLMLVPPSMMTGDQGATRRAIETAVATAAAGYGANPWQVIEKLAGLGEAGATLAEYLTTTVQTRGSRLIFPDRERPYETVDPELGAVLTVITMAGITPPAKGAAREHWTRSEQVALPLLHLAARFAAKAMYSSKEPTTIIMDEAGIVGSGAGSYSAFLVRASRDSRKWNACVIVASQNPADILQLGEEITNLAGFRVVGRMASKSAAMEALRLLGWPLEMGLHAELMAFEPGQFAFNDWDDRRALIQVDIGHRTDLITALDTTPPTLDDTVDLDFVAAEKVSA